ncbi:nucleoporin protein Ndc1-Nup [Crepidotus variabilis]|uniref:Nucleoporin protein Ndc1-Nup n=1 Tax=Crepidotus variabilis TaxID=179855 RepID=A0A9P6E9H9_9AGAR|nr:nucleoporin protein Ndc1-Nup [Crepidotus variabilis]
MAANLSSSQSNGVSGSFSSSSPHITTSHLTATPIRAINSKISARSAPSLPAPSASYEPLVKALFRQRLQLGLLLSGASVVIVVNAWNLWQAGGIAVVGFWGAFWMPLRPWTMSLAFLTWASVAIPIIILRKTFLTSRRSSLSVPLKMLQLALSQSSTRLSLIVYAASALSALLLHVLNEYAQSALDPKLAIFVKSKKHPHYLNGRLLLLVISQLFTAVAYAFRGVLVDRFVYRWAVATNQKKNWLSLMLVVVFLVSIAQTVAVMVAVTLCVASGRVTMPIVHKIPIISAILRPFTAHFVRGQWTILLPFVHFRLICRAWLLSFSTLLIWDITDNLFDQVISETTNLATATSDPNTILVAGTSSKEEFYQFFAFSELRELAMDESSTASSRRSTLFGDQKNILNLWSSVSRESLLLLGHHYQILLRRGRPLPPIPPAAPISTKPMPGPEVGTPTKLLRKSIFKHTKESPGQATLDALASDGPIAQALDAGANATHIPELFKSVEAQALNSPVAEETKKNGALVRGLGGQIKSKALSAISSQVALHIPQPVKDNAALLVDWWERDRLSKQVEASLPFRELDVVVIDALSYLTCSSLTEDRYGVVQRDIPKILEALVSFLVATEEYLADVCSKYNPPSSFASPKEEATYNALAIEVGTSHKTLSYVADRLREGIARIVRTFGDKLLAFKFPPRTAQKLQAFLEYS